VSLKLLLDKYHWNEYIFININILFTDTEGITTVAVKTLKESATEVDRKDLLSELEVSRLGNHTILAN